MTREICIVRSTSVEVCDEILTRPEVGTPWETVTEAEYQKLSKYVQEINSHGYYTPTPQYYYHIVERVTQAEVEFTISGIRKEIARREAQAQAERERRSQAQKQARERRERRALEKLRAKYPDADPAARPPQP